MNEKQKSNIAMLFLYTQIAISILIAMYFGLKIGITIFLVIFVIESIREIYYALNEKQN